VSARAWLPGPTGRPAAEPSTVLDDSGQVGPTVEIPTATHHVMLDSPLALIASLHTLVTVWHRLSGDQP
jgi:hypothetical protein